MNVKKAKSIRRAPDLTVEVNGPLIVFEDKPRSKASRNSGIIASYDSGVESLTKGLKRKAGWETVLKKLKACLETAAAIKTKRGTEFVKLLRDARHQVELIEPR